jgi:hypothetical protein
MIGKAPLQSSVREYQRCLAVVFCFDARVFSISLFLQDFLFLFTFYSQFKECIFAVD